MFRGSILFGDREIREPREKRLDIRRSRRRELCNVATLSDFTLFSACFNGPNNSPSVGNPPPPSAADCNRADADGDGDVDISDYTAFMHCFNKSNQPPACQGDVRPLAYTWDAENRLIEARPLTPQVDDPGNDKKVRFEYDYMNRRVRKLVYTWDGSSWNDATPTEDWRFVYDGYNVVLVLDGRDGEDRGTEPRASLPPCSHFACFVG